MALPSPTTANPLHSGASAVTADALIPILRARSACANEALADSIFGESVTHLQPVGHLGPDLLIALAADNESGCALVEEEQLEALGLTEASAFERCVANLLRRSAPRFIATSQGLFASDWNDGFDASRLLLVHLFTSLHLNGDVVAMAPTSGRLLVTGADDERGLQAMAEAAADALSATDRPLSALPLRLRDGSWTSFVDAAEKDIFQDLQRGQWLRDYAEQKQLLDQWYAQEGQQILVADEIAMLDRKTGRPFCLTFWADGVASLLPRADTIGFKSADEVILVPWAAALAIAGERMIKTDHYPFRYRVDSFPGAVELTQMRAAATLAKAVKANQPPTQAA